MATHTGRSFQLIIDLELISNCSKHFRTIVGICGSDLHFWEVGKCDAWVVESPMICCHESSAIVMEIGQNVTQLKVGDRVAVEPGIPCFKCRFCTEGSYNLCYDMIFQSVPPFDGCLRRFYNYSADFCHKLIHF